jgi:hypothetical protein
LISPKFESKLNDLEETAELADYFLINSWVIFALLLIFAVLNKLSKVCSIL